MGVLEKKMSDLEKEEGKTKGEVSRERERKGERRKEGEPRLLRGSW